MVPFTQQDRNNEVNHVTIAGPLAFSFSGAMLQQPRALQFLSFVGADLTSSSMGTELDMSGSSTATVAACSNSADGVAGERFNKCSCQRRSLHCLSLMRVPPASRMGLETVIDESAPCILHPCLSRFSFFVCLMTIGSQLYLTLFTQFLIFISSTSQPVLKLIVYEVPGLVTDLFSVLVR